MSIWPTIDKFKKQYHLAKKNASLISGDRFNINIKFEKETGISSRLELPPEEKLSRFMVCMRPFANPQDPLYYKTILNFIFANNIIADETNRLRLIKQSQKIENGPIDFQITTESYTALDLFLIFSKGEYFEEDEDAIKILNDIKKVPMIGQLAYFQFHNYAYDVYKLCAEIYASITRFEKDAIRKKNVDEKTDYCCIYCKNKNQLEFNYPEHVFPESLGNTEIILEKGDVCDVCNNGVLSQLDTHLVEHDAISMLKVLYVPINTKTGKYPKAEFQNWKIKKTHPRKITLMSQSGSKKSFIDHSTEDQARFTINAVGRKKFDPILLARSLYKISLGILCLKYGKELVLDRRYDYARNFVVGSVEFFPNSFLLTENFTPDPQVGCNIYHLEGGGTISAFSIFGLKFLLNLEDNPKIEINDKLIKMGAKCFDLNE